jgi:hypothetical protein
LFGRWGDAILAWAILYRLVAKGNASVNLAAQMSITYANIGTLLVTRMCRTARLILHSL